MNLARIGWLVVEAKDFISPASIWLNLHISNSSPNYVNQMLVRCVLWCISHSSPAIGATHTFIQSMCLL